MEQKLAGRNEIIFKKNNQTTQIQKLYKKLSETEKDKRKVYTIIEETMSIPRPTIRRAVNQYLGWKPPKRSNGVIPQD